MFPKVKQKLVGRNLSCSEDLAALDNIMSRLRRNKENVGFLASRITALQASLDQWQSEQINRKLYYLSFLSMVFLPLSVVTGGEQKHLCLSPVHLSKRIFLVVFLTVFFLSFN